MTSTLDLLQKWVLQYHEAAFDGTPLCKIQTIGNGGWVLDIRTEKTSLEQLEFPVVNYWMSHDEIVTFLCEDLILGMVCDPAYLVAAFNILGIILNTGQPPAADFNRTFTNEDPALTKLQEWYLSNCNDGWEYDFGLSISSLPDPGWELNLDLLATQWEDLQLEPASTQTCENDWLHLRTTQRGLQVTCGPLGLATAIDAAFAVLTPENMTYPE